MRLTKKRKLLIVIAVVVAVLTTSVSLIVTSLNKHEKSSEIPPIEYLPIEYSIDVRANFNRNLLIFFKQFFPPITNINIVGDTILDAFSKSRISVKKVNNLGEYLKVSKPDWENYILSLGTVDESGTFVPTEGVEYIIAADMLKLPSVLTSTLLETGFSQNDCSNIVYELILDGCSEKYKLALLSVPKLLVTNLIVNGFEVIEALNGIDDKLSAESIAISFQEALYELGSDLATLSELLGEENFVTLLGLDYKREISDNLNPKDREKAIEYNKTLDLAQELLMFIVDFSSDMLTELPKNTIANFVPIETTTGIDYARSERMAYLSYINLVKTANAAMEDNFNKKITSALVFKNKFVNLYIQVIKLDDLEKDITKDYTELQTKLDAEISVYLNTISATAIKYSHIVTNADIFTLSETAFAMLKLDFAPLMTVDPILLEHTKSITTFIFVNIYNSVMDTFQKYN